MMTILLQQGFSGNMKFIQENEIYYYLYVSYDELKSMFKKELST